MVDSSFSSSRFRLDFFDLDDLSFFEDELLFCRRRRRRLRRLRSSSSPPGGVMGDAVGAMLDSSKRPGLR